MSAIKKVGAVLRHPRQIFWGWRTVLAEGILCSWGYGVYTYAFGNLVQPLQNEFGWTRTEIAAARSIQSLENEAEGPFGGMLADKIGPKNTNLLGMLIAGLALISVYFVNSIWAFYLTYGLCIGIGFNLGLYDPLDVAIANWFVKKRGLAMSISRAMSAFGASIITALSAVIILGAGWRFATVIMGVFTLLIGLPVTWFFVRNKRPEYYGLMPDGASVESEAKGAKSIISAGQELAAKESGETEYTLRKAMRVRAFWILIITTGIDNLMYSLVIVHGIPRLIDLGFDPLIAAGILGLAVFMSVPGRLLAGFLVDRVSTRRLKYIRILSQSLVVFALLVFLFITNIVTVYLFIVLYGTGTGLINTATPAIRARYFGRKAIGTIASTMGSLDFPVTVIAPIYTGWAYDATGSYTSVIWQAIVLVSLSILLFFFWDPPKRLKAVSDLKKIL